jgi:exosortase/archaeosortase family protein
MSRRQQDQPGLSWRSFKQEWRTWLEARKPVLLFGLKFGLLIALLYAVLSTSFFDRALYGYLEANAWLANSILNLCGQGSHVSEVTITSPRFSMAIRRGCDAVEPTWLLCAAMLAFPSRFVPKLYGMLVGIVVLQLLNLLRIISLYWIGIHWPAFFNSAHLEIWPVVFILIAILIFVRWRTWPPTTPKAHAE